MPRRGRGRDPGVQKGGRAGELSGSELVSQGRPESRTLLVRNGGDGGGGHQQRQRRECTRDVQEPAVHLEAVC